MGFDFPYLRFTRNYNRNQPFSHCTRLFLRSILRPSADNEKLKIRTRRVAKRGETERHVVGDVVRGAFRRYSFSYYRAFVGGHHPVHVRFDPRRDQLKIHRGPVVDDSDRAWTATDAFRSLFFLFRQCRLIVLRYGTGTTGTHASLASKSSNRSISKREKKRRNDCVTQLASISPPAHAVFFTWSERACTRRNVSRRERVRPRFSFFLVSFAIACIVVICNVVVRF